MANAFIGLPLATLSTLQTQYVTAIQDIAISGQSISIPGRSLNRANLSEIKNILAEINDAIAIASGTRKRTAVFKFGG